MPLAPSVTRGFYFACITVMGKGRNLALLKSRALELEEQEARLRSENADACYAIIEGWQAKALPVMTPIATTIPDGKPLEPVKPFGFDYSGLPSRYATRQKRWSEV